MKGIFSRIFANRRPIPNIGKMALGFLGFWATVWYSKRSKLSDAQYIFKNTPLNQEIINRMNLFGKDLEFSPTLFLFNGFLQSLYASVFEERYILNYKIQKIQGFGELLRFPNHEQIKKRQLKAPLVVFVLGAEGLSQAVSKQITECYFQKMSVIALKPTDFHNAQSLMKAIDNIKSKLGNKNVYGFGCEYGANLLVNAAALKKELFTSIVTLGNPLDLMAAEQKIEGSHVAKYFYYKDLLKGRLEPLKLQKVPKDVKLFDIDTFIHKFSKQSEVLAFKDKNSSINNLKNIQIPYLLLQSAEDAFTTSVNDERIENDKIICIETKRGGHHQWLQGYTSRLRWGTRLTLQFLKANQFISHSKPDLLL